jgi:hypothetical protein
LGIGVVLNIIDLLYNNLVIVKWKSSRTPCGADPRAVVVDLGTTPRTRGSPGEPAAATSFACDVAIRSASAWMRRYDSSPYPACSNNDRIRATSSAYSPKTGMGIEEDRVQHW